jgi:hypothetical protein
MDLDKLVEICKNNISHRISNGDGELDEKDQWAFGTETYNYSFTSLPAATRLSKRTPTISPTLRLQNRAFQFARKDS